MTVGIYIITNIRTSQVYIGSSQSVEKRFNDHKGELKRGCHHSHKLQKAWDEHGESAFVFNLLQEVENLESLIEVEQQCIDQYKSWQDYNVQKKATRSGARNFDNPLHCGLPMSLNGKTSTGERRYRCRSCGYSRTDSDRPVGRPCEGEQPLTQTEKSQRYRDANREKYRAAEKVRRDRKKFADKPNSLFVQMSILG